MGCHVTFTCDACGATRDGIPGAYTRPDPPLGWVWFWGSPLKTTGPHACSEVCWRDVSKSPDGKFYLPDSHERDADRKNRAMAHAAPEMWKAPPMPPSHPPHPEIHTVVYFIQQGESGPIKIGFSKDPAARLKTLQASSPHPLRLLRTIHGERPREQSIHSKFRRHRLSGEWFAPVPELLEYIATAREIL